MISGPVRSSSLAAVTYFGCTRLLAHSLLCPKLEKWALLPPEATWRLGSRRPPLYRKQQRDAQKTPGALSEKCAVAIVIAKLEKKTSAAACLY